MTEYVWIVEDRGYPGLPTIQKYRLRKRSPNGGATVLARGAVKWFKTCSVHTVCATEDTARMVLADKVEALRLQSVAVLKQIYALPSPLPVTEVPG
jgi:hypothetical protein